MANELINILEQADLSPGLACELLMGLRLIKQGATAAEVLDARPCPQCKQPRLEIEFKGCKVCDGCQAINRKRRAQAKARMRQAAKDAQAAASARALARLEPAVGTYINEAWGV